MPQHPSFPSTLERKPVLARAAPDAQRTLDGVSFNESQLTAMTSVVNQLCSQFANWNTPEQREFVAWLVIRLSRNGICNPEHVKMAVLDALLPRSRLSS